MKDDIELGFRLLSQSDTIERNDQFLEDDCMTWTPATDGARAFIGLPYNPGFYQPMRRLISAA
jgi:hypothetical protein